MALPENPETPSRFPVVSALPPEYFISGTTRCWGIPVIEAEAGTWPRLVNDSEQRGPWPKRLWRRLRARFRRGDKTVDRFVDLDVLTVHIPAPDAVRGDDAEGEHHRVLRLKIARDLDYAVREGVRFDHT